MEDYIDNFEKFEEITVYDFHMGMGGIGDCIKFFIFTLQSCMKNKTRLYYKKNHIEIEKYIKLKYDKMYIDEDTIKKIGLVNIITPSSIYFNVIYHYGMNIQDVFYFTEEVKINCDKLISLPSNYISIHLRLGDKYLETDKRFVLCGSDTRIFSEEKIGKFIEDNYNNKIFFCCDNNSYKLKMKEKHNNIIITNCDVGHSSLPNTTPTQILDAVTEFYILTNSDLIFSGSKSGFSEVASKFRNIPLTGF